MQKPVRGVPFYLAEAYAAVQRPPAPRPMQAVGRSAAVLRRAFMRQGKAVPSEAQWARAHALASAGLLQLQGAAGLSEWTRSLYTAYPCAGAREAPLDDGPAFGYRLAVRSGLGNAAEQQVGGTAGRSAQGYHVAAPGAGFRCAAPLPAKVEWAEHLKARATL
jgi:hypothetical protein